MNKTTKPVYLIANPEQTLTEVLDANYQDGSLIGYNTAQEAVDAAIEDFKLEEYKIVEVSVKVVAKTVKKSN